MRTFKIRRISDGLFSTGGSSPRWRKTGKTWVALNHIQAHLKLIREEDAHRQGPSSYRECEVVEFVCSVGPITPIKNGRM